MFVYAGIDEAGYGPILGPLVVVRSVFLVDRADAGNEGGAPAAPPCLWTTLSSAVARTLRGRQGRLAVADSKALYNASVGLRHLEAGVLGFLGSIGRREVAAPDGPPGSLDELFAVMGDAALRPHGLPWYADAGGGPELPCAADPEELDAAAGRLGEAADSAGVALGELKADVVLEDLFNARVMELGSKAACAWASVALHLQHIWTRFGGLRPLVVIDRQGGRKDYERGLLSAVAGARVEPLERGDEQSRYAVRAAERSMEVIIRVRGEAAHLPVALASMAAKYLRELFMDRFRRYWRTIAPEVEPTAGYFVDGRRFLEEIQPHIGRLGIDPRALIRCR